MILSAWRIVLPQHVAAAFTGEGASLYPGRWNSAGVRIVYTAGSISLAMLEMLVHLREASLLPDYRLIEVTFDASLITLLDAPHLPRNWRRTPPPLSLRRLGDQWVSENRSPVLQVPSAITLEPNYLLNPLHPEFSKLRFAKAQKLAIDARLFPEASTAKIRRKPQR